MDFSGVVVSAATSAAVDVERMRSDSWKIDKTHELNTFRRNLNLSRRSPVAYLISAMEQSETIAQGREPRTISYTSATSVSILFTTR
jgi:hypothetical protein